MNRQQARPYPEWMEAQRIRRPSLLRQVLYVIACFVCYALIVGFAVGIIVAGGAGR